MDISILKPIDMSKGIARCSMKRSIAGARKPAVFEIGGDLTKPADGLSAGVRATRWPEAAGRRHHYGHQDRAAPVAVHS